MRKIKLYAPFLLGIVLLLVMALFLPQVIFRMQDGYRLSDFDAEVRDGSYSVMLSADYETDMQERMRNFLEAKYSEISISSISYGNKNVNEVVVLLENVFDSGWMGVLNEISLGMYDFLQETVTINILDCKKYVVYENTSLENILLMMWYLDVYVVDSNARVRLLVDSETESVYYVKITNEAESYETDKNVVETKVESGLAAQELRDIAGYQMDYYNSYYAAGMDNLEGFSKGVWRKSDVWYVTTQDLEDEYILSFVLPYGNLSLNFEVCASSGDYRPNLAIGMVEIKQLIPEMIQD